MCMRIITALCVLILVAETNAAEAEILPGTTRLEPEPDFASSMVESIDRFLLKEIDEAKARRASRWTPDFSSADTFEKSTSVQRERLARMLGVIETRVPFNAPELVATTNAPAQVGEGDNYNILSVRWPVLSDPQPDRKLVSLHGEGLLLVPKAGEPRGDVIALPACDETPEQQCGLIEGTPPTEQFARHLAEAGFRVIVPALIDRGDYLPSLTRREYIHRSAFELGRHVYGYEVQKVLALVDWLSREGEAKTRSIGAIGRHDGGRIALLASALDKRISAACVAGGFTPLERTWEEPIDRTMFGVLTEFGTAELAVLSWPRNIFVLHTGDAERVWKGPLGAPAKLGGAPATMVDAEVRRCGEWVRGGTVNGISIGDDASRILSDFGSKLAGKRLDEKPTDRLPRRMGDAGNAASRQERQFNEMDRHNQALLNECINARNAFMSPLVKAAEKHVDSYKETAVAYRQKFYEETIGKFSNPLAPSNPRSRKLLETDRWTQYEVVLDVFDGVFAYGILTLPKNLAAGKRAPVVVCQHGLEDRPQDVVEGGKKYYAGFATKLAERGFITFAPQNPYIHKDRFRTLQRKAQILGKSLFSIIIPQHQQIISWLKTLPQVDADKIGFYGLSYGGKTAMRVPAVLLDYSVVICSGDFNEWVYKTTSTSTFAKPFTYANKNEYEMFEWNLGHTYNYAEMAMLIAPRPFMVERGHFDGVGKDELVAAEFARVKRVYDVALRLPGRAQIEWFVGVHQINGQGTYAFLQQFLQGK
jgi:dienelactone hydrolase